jgi:hypothetical protein
VSLIWGKFAAAHALTFSVSIHTQALTNSAYSDAQFTLFRRVLALRELNKATFRSIAQQLSAEGQRSPRGALLSDAHVFSIYKKGKRRFARLNNGSFLTVGCVDFCASVT